MGEIEEIEEQRDKREIKETPCLSDENDDDPDVRIYNQFCKRNGDEAKIRVNFEGFGRVIGDLLTGYTNRYGVSAAYKKEGFRYIVP